MQHNSGINDVIAVLYVSAVADFMLSVSSSIIIVIGSYSLVKCLRKKAKTAAKMAIKMRKSKSNDGTPVGAPSPSANTKKTQVHPL